MTSLWNRRAICLKAKAEEVYSKDKKLAQFASQPVNYSRMANQFTKSPRSREQSAGWQAAVS